jgi:hypothetical protein
MEARIGLLWKGGKAGVLALVLAAGFGLVVTSAQEEKHKMPVIDKITSGGGSHLAFTGKIQVVDVKKELLNVNTVSGVDTEIFPLKKTVHIASADGERLSLNSLTPGTSVLIYYEQKGDRRSIKDIIVLPAAPAEKSGKTKAPPA